MEGIIVALLRPAWPSSLYTQALPTPPLILPPEGGRDSPLCLAGACSPQPLFFSPLRLPSPTLTIPQHPSLSPFPDSQLSSPAWLRPDSPMLWPPGCLQSADRGVHCFPPRVSISERTCRPRPDPWEPPASFSLARHAPVHCWMLLAPWPLLNQASASSFFF